MSFKFLIVLLVLAIATVQVGSFRFSKKHFHKINSQTLNRLFWTELTLKLVM